MIIPSFDFLLLIYPDANEKILFFVFTFDHDPDPDHTFDESNFRGKCRFGFFSEKITNTDTAACGFILKFGTGISSLWSGKMDILTFENELEFRFSKYFSSSLILAYGKNKAGSLSFTQIGIDVYCSPFGNFKKNNFKFGFGVVRTNDSEYAPNPVQINNHTINNLYRKVDNNDVIGNLVLQYSYAISKKMELGLKYSNKLYMADKAYHTRLLINVGLKI